MANYDSNSLIDWNEPAVEYLNKPLIPLPSFDNPIDIAEDNPFDAVQRQINENGLLDIFNLNISFNNDSKCEDDIHVALEEVVEHSNNVSSHNCATETSVDDGVTKTTLNKIENDASLLDTSFIADVSSLTDFKEMVKTRISCCLNQAFNYDYSKSSTMPSSESEKSAFSFQTNDSYIQRSDELKNSDFKSSEIECEDLLSMKLNWDDYITSSSDEENDKPFLEKPKSSNPVKRTSTKLIERIKDVRAPLISQDPNIRIKKSNVTSKQGPLKAIVPIPSKKRLDDRKTSTFLVSNGFMDIAEIITNAKIMTSSKLKVTSTHPSKLKKWTSPIASSTPQNSKNSSLSMTRRSLISNPSPMSSIEKQNKTFSHPPSPDSTTDSKSLSRSMSASRVTPKSYLKNVSSSLVSSSTKDSSRFSLKASKDIGIKSCLKNVRNKENLRPFRN